MNPNFRSVDLSKTAHQAREDELPAVSGEESWAIPAHRRPGGFVHGRDKLAQLKRLYSRHPRGAGQPAAFALPPALAGSGDGGAATGAQQLHAELPSPPTVSTAPRSDPCATDCFKASAQPRASTCHRNRRWLLMGVSCGCMHHAVP
jgi:hypothetical protein